MSAEQLAYADGIERLHRLVQSILGLARPGGSPTRHSRIDSLHIRVELAGLPPELAAEVAALDRSGHHAAVVIEHGSFRCEVEFAGSQSGSVRVVTGSPDQAPAGIAGPAFTAACENDNAAAALRLGASVVVAMEISIANDPAKSGHHWIASAADLARQLKGEFWASILQIAEGPPILVVQDADALTITGSHVQICGPRAQPAPLDPVPVAGTAGLFTDLPTVGVDAPLSGVVPLLHGVARTIVWADLATTVDRGQHGDGSWSIVLDGARVISLKLHPTRWPAGSSADDLRLWRWATTGDDPGRRHAAIQAATLAIVDADDIGTAAGPALRNAQHLYDLSRQTAIAESLASRRSAREAVAGAARDAVKTSREVTAKSVERMAVQAAAVVAVIIVRANDTVPAWAAALSLILLLALTVVSGIVNRIALHNAADELTADKSDLDQYRTALGKSEIDTIKQGNAVAQAETSNRQARRLNLWMHVIVGATLAVLTIFAISFQPAAGGPGGVPTSNTAPASPSPVSSAGSVSTGQISGGPQPTVPTIQQTP